MPPGELKANRRRCIVGPVRDPGPLAKPMTLPPKSSESRLRSVLCGGLLVLAFALFAAGCGGFSNAGKGSAEQQKAQELVSSAHAAGVAPHLTVEVAEALYGNDAAGVCKVFEGGLTTAERNDLLGNPANRRPKTITTDAIDVRAPRGEDVLPGRAVSLQQHRRGSEPRHVLRLAPRIEPRASVAPRFPSRPAHRR